MDETQAKLLEQLRDIHASAEPGWWPPAPGWWVLATVLVVLLGYLVYRAYGAWRAYRRRQRLVSALENISQQWDPAADPHRFLAEMNKLFRVVALRAFPGTSAVRLQGADWVSYIESMLPDSASTTQLQALATGPYEPSPEFDQQGLVQLARLWVRRYG